MRDHRPQLTEALFANNRFSDIQKKATALARFNIILGDILPPESQQHCRVANYRQGSLVIETSSPSWKMRINYDRLRVISQFRQHGLPSLTNIEVVINPELGRGINTINTIKKEVYKERVISKVAASSILAVSEIATPKLKELMKKIAAHAKK